MPKARCRDKLRPSSHYTINDHLLLLLYSHNIMQNSDSVACKHPDQLSKLQKYPITAIRKLIFEIIEKSLPI
jgi:hypothetical protein